MILEAIAKVPPIFLTLFLALAVQATERLELTEAKVLALALEKNLGVQIASLDQQIGTTGIQAAKGAFDTLLELEVDHLIDKSDQATTIFGTDNRTTNFNFGVSRLLPSGTRAALEWQNKRESTNSVFATLNPYYESIMSLSVEQPLLQNFLGMQDRGTVTLAKNQADSVAALADHRTRAAILQVLVDYWNWITQAQLTSVARRSVQEAHTFERLAFEKESLGLYEATDVLAAQAGRLQMENQLADAIRATEDARGRLLRGLNLIPETTLVSSETITAKPKLPSLADELSLALAGRSDYLAVRTQVEEKRLSLQLAKNRRWPELDLVASLQLNGINAAYGSGLSEISSADHPSYFIGANFKWPIENRLARSKAKRTELEKMRVLLELKQLENQITQEVEEQWRAMETTLQQVTSNRRIEELQRKKWQQELAKYRTGRSSSDLVIRYQEDYLNAERITLDSLLRHQLATLGLKFATNTLVR